MSNEEQELVPSPNHKNQIILNKNDPKRQVFCSFADSNDKPKVTMGRGPKKRKPPILVGKDSNKARRAEKKGKIA